MATTTCNGATKVIFIVFMSTSSLWNTTFANLVNDVDIFLVAQSVVINLNISTRLDHGVAIMVSKNKVSQTLVIVINIVLPFAIGIKDT
jgi:hypothetical protein